MMAAGYGRIVNTASIAGKEGNPNASAYSAAKAGVIALTKSLGKELAEHDIAVNCVTPAAAKTRIFDQITDEFVQYMLAKIPRGRFVKVEEIAAMVAWMASAGTASPPARSSTTAAARPLRLTVARRRPELKVVGVACNATVRRRPEGFVGPGRRPGRNRKAGFHQSTQTSWSSVHHPSVGWPGSTSTAPLSESTKA